MKLAKKIVIGTLLITLLLVIGIYGLPLPNLTNSLILRSVLAFTVALALVYVASAALFLISLKAYKADMRRAFIMLAIGIIITAIAAVQLPISNIFGLTNSLWSKSGLIIIPFLLGVLAIYAGVRMFAQLVGTQTVFTKARMTILVVTILSALSAFVPHVVSSSTEIQLDVSNGIILWIGLLDLVSALIILQIKQRIGTHYTNAMAWLFAALIGSSVLTVFVFLNGILTSGDVDLTNAGTDLLTLAMGFVYMRAGYAFTQTEDY